MKNHQAFYFFSGFLEVTKNINSESTNSFVIKRYASDAQNIVQVNHQGTDNRINQYQRLLTGNSIKYRKRMEQRYKGKILQNKDTCYYYPINDNHNHSNKSYLICDSLVRRFASLIDCWEFDSRQSVALIYYLCERKNFYNVPPVEYATFYLQDGLAVDGFVFSANSNELIEYIGSSFKKSDVALTVVYSTQNLTYQSLCETYGNCDCVLWINPRDANEFEFYVFDAKEMKKNFNVRSRSSFAMEQHIPERSIQSEKELWSNWISRLSLSYNEHITSSGEYLQAEYDAVLPIKFTLTMKKVFLVYFLERIRRYEKITGSFTIIISYISNEKPPTNSILKINPMLDEILRIWFFTQNNCYGVDKSVCLKGLNKCGNGNDIYTKQNKVAFIISNRDVNIDSFKNKLFGHSSAVCFNIETQNCCFYQLR